jgi:hypothetical protein
MMPQKRLMRSMACSDCHMLCTAATCKHARRQHDSLFVQLMSQLLQLWHQIISPGNFNSRTILVLAGAHT